MTEESRSRVGALLARLYRPTGFRGPVVTLMSGAGLALVITYASQLVLARLYPPDAFGVADYFVMAVTVLVSLASLHYEDAVMSPASHAAAARILKLATLLAVASSALLVAAAIWPVAVAGAIGVPELAPWLWLLPIALLLTKMVRLLELWLSRLKRFRLIGGGQVSAAGTTAAVRIGAGASSAAAGAGGLIGGFVAGQVAALALLLPAAWRNRGVPARQPDVEDALPSLMDAARQYRRFALFSTPAAVLNAAFSRLPTILLPLYFSWTVVGYYGRAFVALAIPLGLVGNAVAQVFFVHAGEAMRAGSIGRLTVQVQARLVMIGLMPTLAVMIAGPELFEILLGEPWRTSGEYLRFVAPWMMLASIASPLTRVFDVLERQRTDLACSLGMIGLQTTALVVGGRSGDVMFTLLLLGVAGVIARAAHLIVIMRVAHARPASAIMPYVRYGLYSAIPALAIAASVSFASPAVTVLTTILALAAYYGTVAVREDLLTA